MKQLNESSSDNVSYADYYDILLTFQLVMDLLAFIIIPFACFIGLLLNMRVIWTVIHNVVELKEDFYLYMMINSIFNSLFCIIYAFYPINYCLKNETGYFCSTIYNSMTAQVVKIVLIGYFGEVFKMCSNISFVFVTINRYMLVGKEHSATLEQISKWSMKRVIYGTLLFSFLINIGHAFQYRINWGWGELLQNVYETYDIYPSIVINNSGFRMYTIAYFLINFVLFLAVNTAVEVSLLLKLRKEIAEKRVKTEEDIRLSRSKNTSGADVINKIIKLKQRKLEQDGKKETRAIVMVITNSGFNFFLRLPEILVFLSSNYSLMQSLINNSQNNYSPFINNFSSTILSIS
jgi:hypothetical protein